MNKKEIDFNNYIYNEQICINKFILNPDILNFIKCGNIQKNINYIDEKLYSIEYIIDEKYLVFNTPNKSYKFNFFGILANIEKLYRYYTISKNAMFGSIFKLEINDASENIYIIYKDNTLGQKEENQISIKMFSMVFDNIDMKINDFNIFMKLILKLFYYKNDDE